MYKTRSSTLFPRLAISICLLALLSVPVSAQYTNYSFTQLTVEDGLANNWCFSALQDSQGYMWFGTQDGVSRYDGYTFKNFEDYYEGGIDTMTIQGSSVMDIVEGRDGRIWMATVGGGLVQYNPETGSFKNYPTSAVIDSTENIMFVDLMMEGDSLIWIGAFDTGLLRFHIPSKSFKRYNLYQGKANRQESFRRNSIHEIIQDKQHDELLWIAGNNGLYSFHKTLGQLEYFPQVVNGQRDSFAAVMDVFMDDDYQLWAGTWGVGLGHFNIQNKSWKYYSPNQGDRVIYDVLDKSADELWLGSQDQGLLIFNKNTKAFKAIKHDPTNRFSISNNSINAIYKDPDDRLWISNYKEGLSILDPAMQLFEFTSLQHPVFCPEGQVDALSDFALSEHNQEIYVVNSACRALFVFDINKNLKQTIQLPVNGLPAFKLLLDKDNRLWITASGTAGSNNLFYYETGMSQCISFDWNSLNAPNFQYFELTDIIQDKQGQLWIGTKYKGVLLLNLQNNSIQQFIQSASHPDYPATYVSISDLMQDTQGNIWVATLEEGIYVLNPSDESSRHFNCYVCIPPKNGLFEKRINSVLEDQNGMIWVGTGDLGIQILDPALPKSQLTKAFRMEEGMPNEKIRGLVKDKENIIWAATHKGLCRFDQDHRFVVYGKKDGLQDPFLGNGFNIGENGEIFIGQDDGFYSFQPKNSYKNEKPPPIVFTNFKVLEEELSFNKDLNFLKRIELKPAENFFSIGFAALNFSQPDKNRYAYKLDGLDKEWIYPSDNRNVAPYTNVPPGRYTFKVKAANNEGIWNEEGISIEILLKAPWYRRTWAMIIWLGLLLTGVWWLYQFQMRRQYEQQEAKRLKELDVVKNRLYTNITHEFRTPLTVIMGMTEHFKGITNLKQLEAIKLIKRNSNNLLTLVNQMLDLSKLESGNLNLHLVQDDIIAYLRYLTESFNSVAASKNQQLIFYTETPELLMDFDEERIKQILSNLISNAIKFTPQDGTITIHCSETEQSGKAFLKIKVQDTGVGISEQDTPFIFNRFYQVESHSTRKGEGTGIGLALTKELVEMMQGDISVESRPEHGTTFSILLPVETNNALVQKKRQLEETEIPLAETNPLETALLQSSSSKSDEAPLLLLVEDNPDVVRYVHSLLVDDYNIIIAQNGQEGIDKAIEIIPDIIISDVMMPIKDGFEVCATLKQDERTSHIPIILLTAKATQEDKIEGLEYGADAYLVKPFNKEELFIRLKKLIELRQKLQAQYAKFDPEAQVKAPKPRPIEDAFILKLKGIVEENLDNPELSIADLCRAALLSHTQVYRKLKALTGKTPSQFIRSIRLQKARVMLEDSTLTISEIAYDVGFNDPNYFSRTFLQEFGHPPSALRK